MVEMILTAAGILAILVGPVAFWSFKAMKRSKELAHKIAASEAEDARKEHKVMTDEMEAAIRGTMSPLGVIDPYRDLVPTASVFAADAFGRITTVDIGPGGKMSDWTLIKKPMR